MRRDAIIRACGVCLSALLCFSAVEDSPRLVGWDDWQLDFTFHDPQRISVRLPGDSQETNYWYMLYTVTNSTGQDVKFYPSIDAVTDGLAVVEGGAEIHPMVYDAIAARHKKDYPFFAAPWKISGILLQGEDNARTSAAVFRTFEEKASSFTVFVGGLSGYVERAKNPAFNPTVPESAENPRFFVLRKTLAIRYDLPGDPQTRQKAAPVRRSREWVMR